MLSILDAEYDKLKVILEQRLLDLLEVTETGKEAAGTVELDQQKVGRLSRMDALQAQAMSKETNRRREIEIQRIRTALHRFEDDEYGICVSCGDEIALQRLEIEPATPVCIGCASIISD